MNASVRSAEVKASPRWLWRWSSKNDYIVIPSESLALSEVERVEESLTANQKTIRDVSTPLDMTNAFL